MGEEIKYDAANLPSIDDARPQEEGGPIARIGFNYQDEIAVSLLIDMLESPRIAKIHCETHDDIVVVRESDSAEQQAEYVQVKASEQDKFWSLADLCRREQAKPGTSILETSLSRDKHRELSSFRLVTLRPVVNALAPLTHPLSTPARISGVTDIQAICQDLETRYPDLVSPKGNRTDFWATNCFWDQRDSEDAVAKDSLVRLIRMATREGLSILLEQAEVLLEELRALAKAAGAARWHPDPGRKIVTRTALRTWWENRVREVISGASARSGEKLQSKMADAALPDDLIGLAKELRLEYASESRAPRYLEVDEARDLKRRVTAEISTLRSNFVAGKLDVDSAGFHALCLDRMDAISASLPKSAEDRSAFLKGCLYDIADRCLLKFTRSPQ